MKAVVNFSTEPGSVELRDVPEPQVGVGEVIMEVDTVSVCTYNQAHKDPTVTALQAGKHVFCEKPMAATLEDATEMVRVARSSGRILQIGIHSTFGSDTQFARQLVDHGVLGDIYCT